jgi:hypothetical protein
MRTTCAMLIALALSAPALAAAQPVARPPDLGYGDQETSLYGLLDPADADVARVDERVARDALAGVGVASPNAQLTPPRHLVLANLSLFGLRASYGLAPRVDLAASLFVTPRLFSPDAPRFDSTGDVGARWGVAVNRNLDLTLGAVLGWRAAPVGGEGAELGVGLSVAADLKASDTLVLGAGVAAYAPLWLAYTIDEIDGCVTRDDLARGGCVSQRDVSLGAPAAGRFVTGWASLTALVGQGFSFKLEASTGASVGASLGVEAGIWGDVSQRARRARARESRWGWGVPNGAPFTAGAALGWSDGLLAAQLGATLVPGRTLRVEGDSGDWIAVLPMIWFARRFAL